MVDFNQGETITTAPKDLLKVMILERWNNCIEALESYDRRVGKGFQSDTYELIARLRALYNILSSAMKKDLPAKDFKAVKDLTTIEDYNSLLKLYSNLSDWLFDKQLIDVFTGKKYDSTKVEIENNNKGL